MKTLLWIVTFLFVLHSCRIVDRLENDQATLGLINPKQYEEIIAAQQKQTTSIDSQVDESATNNKKKDPLYTIAHLDENGDPLIEVALKGVSVYASRQVVSERKGQVQINFKVYIPASLQNKDWQLSIQPFLHLEDEKKALEPLYLLGSFASLLQQRDYWRYEKVRNRILRKSNTEELSAEQEMELYNRFSDLVVHPVMTRARLNSIVQKGENRVYDYVQEIPTSGTYAGKELQVTLEGTVKAIDRSFYRIPVRDTLQYNIASMLSFVDPTPRNILNVFHKYVTVSSRHDIVFEQGGYKIDENAGNNRVELDSLQVLLRRMLVGNEYFIDSLILTSRSSPEGRAEYNDWLSEKRAYALREYICQRFGKEVESIFKVRWKGEDWETLMELLRTDPAIKERDKILKAMAQYRNKPDDREYYLRRYCRTDFPYISSELYPKLRQVDLKYSLRRRKMVQDTLYTNELDTIYMAGLKHLQKREYARALYYLADYPCINTAITLLSLDYNQRAHDMLVSLPKNAEVYYLLTIASIRLNKIKEARKSFDMACSLKTNLEFRKYVDPELTKIMKQ